MANQAKYPATMLLKKDSDSRGRDIDFALKRGARLDVHVPWGELDRQPLNAVAHDHARVMTVLATVSLEEVAHCCSSH